jgi:hypothetical protein
MESMRARINKVATQLREMVQHHEDGTYMEGVEAFNSNIMKVIEEAGLQSLERKHVDKVGVHPSNRELSMLVPIDVHDLLLKFADNGWNEKLWDAMALTIPSGVEGDEWKTRNVELVSGSDELLAPMTHDCIELVTGRGSHSTAALRLAKFGGAKSIHAKLAGPDGKVSQAKLLELQPSFKEPLEQGVLYKVIPGELELAVPGLLACLSRIGNASHDVYRQQTVLQLCARIHSIVVAKQQTGNVIDWQSVAQQACVGNGGCNFVWKAEQLCDFVRAWSGGEHASLLLDLAMYERSIQVKRKLFAADMQALSTVDLVHAHRYVGVTSLDIATHIFYKLVLCRSSLQSIAVDFYNQLANKCEHA